MPRIFLFLLLLMPAALAAPLSTRGRWIIDAATGGRAKLRCVNWAAHLPPVLAEGLDKKPLTDITSKISALGFNCVRLTWATSLFTSSRYDNLTVSASLTSLSLHYSLAGLLANNPSMATLTVRDAFDHIVYAIGLAGLTVVLDNHVSNPRWCCGEDDGNGFFGDKFFDVHNWLNGLSVVATRFRNFSQVVGMSLRNELRGRRQGVDEWYTYVALGASAVREANPRLLVIVSGLSYDTDLSFLRRRPLLLPSNNNLVFEVHWYSFSRRRDWEKTSPTRVCAEARAAFDSRAGFLLEKFPLFVSEFGVDQRGEDLADNRFLSCFLGVAAERDLDWALWALQGSYYLRENVAGFKESYGVLDSDWELTRNPIFKKRFGLIQDIMRQPESSTPEYIIIYHPLSGECIHADEISGVVLADCRNRSKFYCPGEGKPIFLMGSNLCLKVSGNGLPAKLSDECGDFGSNWEIVSQFYLSAADAGGKKVCLQNASTESSSVLTNDCLCISDPVCSHNPQTQWFYLIPSNIPI